MLHNIACGLGRRGDADDILQILYARWWQRIGREPGWCPPEDAAALFVCVKRVVLDEVAKERRSLARQGAHRHARLEARSPEDALHAFERLQWILARLPAPLAEALQASLSAGRRRDAALAQELGLTKAAFTQRLFKARRAAEELASYYDVLSRDQAELMAELRFSGKTRAQIAHELSLLLDEVTARWREALEVLERNGLVSAQ